MSERKSYVLAIDGELFCKQREALLAVTVSTEDDLHGLVTLTDEIADQAYHLHGIDCLIKGDDENKCAFGHFSLPGLSDYVLSSARSPSDPSDVVILCKVREGKNEFVVAHYAPARGCRFWGHYFPVNQYENELAAFFAAMDCYKEICTQKGAVNYEPGQDS